MSRGQPEEAEVAQLAELAELLERRGGIERIVCQRKHAERRKCVAYVADVSDVVVVKKEGLKAAEPREVFEARDLIVG